MRDEKIIRMLKKANRPLSTDAISVFCGMDRKDTHTRLNSLQKWKKVKKVTSKRVDFWNFY